MEESARDGWKRGIVRTDNGEVIARPLMLWAQLPATPLVDRSKTERWWCGWKRVTLGPMRIDGLAILASATFHLEVLSVLSLALTQEQVLLIDPAFRQWSESKAEVAALEALVARMTDPAKQRRRWLTQAVNRRTYWWGSIWTGFDARGGFASIQIKYVAP